MAFSIKQALAKKTAPAADVPSSPLAAAATVEAKPLPTLETRRYLWTARAYGIALYLSLVVNLALAGALLMLAPLKRVDPMLVSFSDKNEQVVQIQPFPRGTEGFNAMTEKMVGEYVKIREEILPDDAEMAERYSTYLFNRTTNAQFGLFQTEASKRYTEFRAGRLSRYVDIIVVNRQGAGYIVEYTTTDIDNTGRERQKLTWQATLSVDYQPRQVTYSEQYVNPLGFIVTDYQTRTKRQ